MSAADIGVVIVVSLIMMSVIFFYFIFPRLRHKGNCASCPVNKEKKIKRAFKDYHKKNK